MLYRYLQQLIEIFNNHSEPEQIELALGELSTKFEATLGLLLTAFKEEDGPEIYLSAARSNYKSIGFITDPLNYGYHSPADGSILNDPLDKAIVLFSFLEQIGLENHFDVIKDSTDVLVNPATEDYTIMFDSITGPKIYIKFKLERFAITESAI